MAEEVLTTTIELAIYPPLDACFLIFRVTGRTDNAENAGQRKDEIKATAKQTKGFKYAKWEGRETKCAIESFLD